LKMKAAVFIAVVFLFAVSVTIHGESPPAASSSRTTITALSAGWLHTCALTASGGVICWGRNRYGRLGNGTRKNSRVPVHVIGLHRGVKAIEVGGEYSCAVTHTGGVKCWGRNSYGMLGDGTTENRFKPVNVWGLSKGVVAISSSAYHACALMETGGVKCWGHNQYGKLGDGTALDRHKPVDVKGLDGPVAAIAAGLNHTCVLMTSGAVKCWGDNYSGQLGVGTSGWGRRSYKPITVIGLGSSVKAIESGWLHTCVILKTGGVRCWGRNFKGQLGNGTIINSSRPIRVSGLSGKVVSLQAWEEHNCALMESGDLKCWGGNEYGQFGTLAKSKYLTPISVKNFGEKAVLFSTGCRHTCVLTSSGKVKCWGYNRYGLLGEAGKCGKMCVKAIEVKL